MTIYKDIDILHLQMNQLYMILLKFHQRKGTFAVNLIFHLRTQKWCQQFLIKHFQRPIIVLIKGYHFRKYELKRHLIIIWN